jgi:hypothetical protein
MRSLVIACAVMLLAGTACASVPDATLASFGLGGMQQMSDAQGLNVRGMGFASVGGVSVATAPGAFAANDYSAVSNTGSGNYVAAGATISVAAAGGGVFTPIGNAGIVVGSVAFGGSVAFASH